MPISPLFFGKQTNKESEKTGKNIVTRRLMVGTTVMGLVGEDPKRKALLVFNNGAAIVYILGAKGQTSTDGIPVPAGTSYDDSESTGELFIVSEAAETDVRVMTVGE